MNVKQIDHLVLTVRDIQKTINFYTTVMGMEEEEFAGGRKAIKFGEQKINLHLLGHELEPKAQHVRAGSADLCFIVGAAVEQVIQELVAKGIEVIDGPVIRPSNGSDCISLLSRSGR